MLENIISSNYTKEQREEHEKKWGGYNDAPPNMVEITPEEFAQSGFFTWCHTARENRQVCDRNNRSKPMMPLMLFYMNHGDNYAMSHDYWAKKVRYFKFALCYHDYKEIAPSQPWACWHTEKCTKCGHTWSYDSSG